MRSPCLQGKTSTTERPVEPSSNGSSMPKNAEEIIAGMPKEQQKQLSQIYFFLTQVQLFRIYILNGFYRAQSLVPVGQTQVPPRPGMPPCLVDGG